MGYSLIATKGVELLKSTIKSGDIIVVGVNSSGASSGENISIHLNELTYQKSTGSNYVISHETIYKLCKSILVLKDDLEQHLQSLYAEFLIQLLDYIEWLERFWTISL